VQQQQNGTPQQGANVGYTQQGGPPIPDMGGEDDVDI